MAEYIPFAWGARTYIMGVLNVTPDSFSGDGLYQRPREVLQRARAMVAAGADVLDIGGESTRPGYSAVSEEAELRRVLPPIEMIVDALSIPVSIDTRKSVVARRALDSGASIVNDVSGLHDPDMIHVVARAGAGLVIVHAREVEARGRLMPSLVQDLSQSIELATRLGIARSRITIDPGLGFGKAWGENFQIVRELDGLRVLNCPVLLGPSRKGMIGRVLGTDAADRVEGTIALATLAVAGGADMLRVHDVRALSRGMRMADALARGDQVGRLSAPTSPT